jgi:acyl-CoA synthetase (NDP forming)
MSNNPLHRLMNPSSIATVGAGNNPMKMGTMHALSIINDGYKGAVYPIHPHEKTILGLRAYPSVADLPVAPDLAFLIVPASQVLQIIEEFGKKGTTTAIIVTAGFGEMGEEGLKAQETLNERAKNYGIRFLGPNCIGIINSEISLNTTVMPYTDGEGKLGFASQSGTYVTQTIPYLGKRGIRFSKAISVGNSANITITDALEYLGEDAQTRAIALYIEGLTDIPRFVEVARSITPHKPVLAQYVGGSGAGARASMSHTGSLAAADHLYDGLFRQVGIIRVHSIEKLFSCGNMLALQPMLKGKRIGVLTNSGGPGTAIANALEKGGLDVPEFSQELQENIRPMLPPHAPRRNPVDMTFSMNLEALTNKIPELMLKSGEVDGIIIHGAMTTGMFKASYPHFKSLLNDAPMESILATMEKQTLPVSEYVPVYQKPVAISSFYDRDDNYTAAYEDQGIPVFDAPEKAAEAMAIMLRYKEIRERKPWTPVIVPAPLAEAKRIIHDCLSRGEHNLDEHGSKAFLKLYGVPVTEERMVNSADEAAAAADAVGYPLVIKASASDIVHKTGKGLVYLHLTARDAAVDSYRKIQKAAGKKVPVIVYRMVPGDREFVAGIVCAPGFAPAVLFGLGGIFTEALGDAAFRPAPLSTDDATEMIQDIQSKKLLGAFRGMPAVNIESLSELLHRLSLIPLMHPEVSEIDINPIVIEGSSPVAVDALVVFHNERKRE